MIAILLEIAIKDRLHKGQHRQRNQIANQNEAAQYPGQSLHHSNLSPPFHRPRNKVKQHPLKNPHNTRKTRAPLTTAAPRKPRKSLKSFEDQKKAYQTTTTHTHPSQVSNNLSKKNVYLTFSFDWPISNSFHLFSKANDTFDIF